MKLYNKEKDKLNIFIKFEILRKKDNRQSNSRGACHYIIQCLKVVCIILLIIAGGTKRKRKKKIMWFNQPYNMDLKTPLGKRFLELIDLHFPKVSVLHPLINKKKKLSSVINVCQIWVPL